MRKFESSTGKKISPGRYVKVKRMNHIIEVMALDRLTNGFQKIKKLSKTEYVVLETGEVLEYNLSENRGENAAGLKKTFRKIRDLINNNFNGSGNELHVTLTYADNMTDLKRLHNDFRNFWKRYKRRHGDVDYLSVVEPQGRGAWHCHVLIRHNDQERVFIPSKEIAELWGHGFVKVKSLKDIDNIGAYLSAYLGDIELDEDSIRQALNMQNAGKLEIKEVEIEGVKKSIIKGGRLHMYPPGMNMYRKSKGILFPEVVEVPYKDIKKIVGSRPPNYSRTITISDNDQVLNTITYEQYNLKRGK